MLAEQLATSQLTVASRTVNVATASANRAVAWQMIQLKENKVLKRNNVQ